MTLAIGPFIYLNMTTTNSWMGWFCVSKFVHIILFMPAFFLNKKINMELGPRRDPIIDTKVK